MRFDPTMLTDEELGRVYGEAERRKGVHADVARATLALTYIKSARANLLEARREYYAGAESLYMREALRHIEKTEAWTDAMIRALNAVAGKGQ
jgi:hypothetical protein